MQKWQGIPGYLTIIKGGPWLKVGNDYSSKREISFGRSDSRLFQQEVLLISKYYPNFPSASLDFAFFPFLFPQWKQTCSLVRTGHVKNIFLKIVCDFFCSVAVCCSEHRGWTGVGRAPHVHLGFLVITTGCVIVESICLPCLLSLLSFFLTRDGSYHSTADTA